MTDEEILDACTFDNQFPLAWMAVFFHDGEVKRLIS
jgi:hypothetical protein